MFADHLGDAVESLQVGVAYDLGAPQLLLGPTCKLAPAVWKMGVRSPWRCSTTRCFSRSGLSVACDLLGVERLAELSERTISRQPSRLA